MCDNCFSVLGDCALPPVAVNPDVTAECPVLKIIFIIDESGSVAAAGAQSDVKDGVLAFVSALRNTGAEVALIEFAHNAALVSDYVEVDDSYVSDIAGYFNGTPLNGQTYSAGGSTNWQSALDTALSLDTANLVLFFTDGNPTSYTTGAGTTSVCISSGLTEQPEVVNPMKLANYIKDSLNTHIFMLGVGSVILDTLTNLSGTTAWQSGVNDIMTSDYSLESFSTLAAGLRQFALDLCGTHVALDMLAPGAPVCLGETITLTVKVTNTGSENAAVNMVVRDTFPNGIADITCISNCADVCVGSGCSPAIGGNTLEWSIDNLAPGDSSVMSVQVMTAAVGTHTNSVWLVANNADTMVSTHTIEVLDKPVIDIGNDLFICTGGSAQVVPSVSAGTPPYSYLWSTGDTSSTITVAPLDTSLYSCTVTDANLCTSWASMSVNVVDDPVVEILNTGTELCDGGQTTLTASVTGGTGTTSYQWQFFDALNGWEDVTGATAAAFTTPTLTPGTYNYRLNVSQNSGCDVASDQVDVVVFQDPNISVSTNNPEVCLGGASLITASVSGGTSNATLQWQVSTDGAAWSNIAGETGMTYNAPVDTPGTTYYRAVLTDGSSGCGDPVADFLTVTVVEDPVVAITASDNEVCAGGMVELALQINGGSSALTIQWQDSDNGISGWDDIGGATDTTYQPPTSSAGVTYYRAVVTDPTIGCTVTNPDIVDIQVNDDPTAQVFVDHSEVCIGGTAEFVATIYGGSPLLSYYWQSSPDGISNWTDTGVSDTSFTPPSAVPGTYYYRVRIDDETEGCNDNQSATTTFVVSDTSTATATASNAQPCENEPILLSASISGGSSQLSYHWQSSPDGIGSWTDVGVSDTDFAPATTPVGLHYYRVRIEDGVENCNEPTSNVVMVDVLERPAATADRDDAFCLLPNGEITISFADHPTRTEVEFSLNDQVSYEAPVQDNSGQVTYSGFAPGTYLVWARWANDECPTFVDTITIVNLDCGSICGTVQDDTGSPISNVKIWLYADSDGDGDEDGIPLDSTFSDSDAGNFCFEDLAIGDYVLVEEQPLNYDDVSDYDHLTDGLDTDGIDTLIINGTDTTVQLSDNDIPVTLHADESDLGNIFIEDPHTGQISGYVVDDRNDPLTGLYVELHHDLDNDGIPDGLIAATATTNVLGYYQFTGVEPGYYVLVSEQLPQHSNISDVDTSIIPILDPDGDDSVEGPDNNIPVILLPGEIDEDNLFVDGRPGSVCGYVMDDTGLPIANVTIELYLDLNGDGDRDSVAIASTETDSTGLYCFDDIEPRDYVLFEIQPAFYDDVSDYDHSITALDTDGLDTAGVGPDNDIPVVLDPGEIDHNNNFIEDPHVGSITGWVYDDIGGKMPNVTIELYADSDKDGLKDSLLATQSTDAQGAFSFANYEPGYYVLEQIQPFPYVSIADRDTSISASDLDGDDAFEGPDNDIQVILMPGETDADNSFEEGRPGTVCGTVYDDLLNPISFVLIYLYIDSTGNGEPDGDPVDSTVTDGDTGNYCFSDIEGGDYVVVEVQPANYDDISDIDLTVGATDPDGNDGLIPDNDIPVTLAWGEEDMNNDFIEDPHPGNISGYVVDQNIAPIPGVTIYLYGDSDKDGVADGPVLDSTTTNLSAYYIFSLVEPGFYVLVEAQPANHNSISDFDHTPDPDGNDNAEGADDDIPVILSPGEDDEDNNFYNGGPGTICGNVRDDRGEPVPNVLIRLYGDTNGDGVADGQPLDSVLTDSLTGNYCFTEVTPFDYVLVQEQPPFYDDLFDFDMTTDALDPDGNDSLELADNDIPVTLAPSEADGGNDFIEDPHVGTISGTVTDDTGAGMAGVTIYLYPDADRDGEPDTTGTLGSQVTNGAGDYTFASTEPGWYVLVEEHPFPYSSISDFDATPDPDGDDASDLPDDNIPVVLMPGESDEDNDFVNGRPGDISGRVEDDLASPISLVKIYLYLDTDADGVPDGAPIDSALSDGDSGNYSFSDLQPNTYVVEEVQPFPYGELEDYDRQTDSLDTDGDDRAEGQDNNIPVVLTPGESDEGNDFINIICPDQPVITGDSMYTVCDGGQVTFTAIAQNLGTEVYSWDFGDGATPATATGLGPHVVTYDLTANNQANGADVVLEITKDGCTTQQTQVSDVFVNPYPDATINASTVDLCWYGPRNFVPAEPEMSGADYTWDFGPGAAPSTATGYGPHTVEYSTTGSKQVQLTVDANYPGVTCTASESITFDVVECYGNIAGGVYSDSTGGAPITNVLILLHADNDVDGLPDGGPPLAFTFTTASGSFAFTIVDPGTYVLEQIQPSGFASLYDEDTHFDIDSVANTNPFDDLIPVTVEPNITDSGNDFFESLELASVTGSVFEDHNGDDAVDPGEGIANVTIRLHHDADKDGMPDPGPPLDSVITDTAGFYAFMSLDTGTYVIVEVQPVPYLNVRDRDATDDGDVVANVDQQDDIIPASLFAGETDTDNNFEESSCSYIVENTNDDGVGSLRRVITCASEGDTIWFDAQLAGDTIQITSTVLEIDKNLILYAPHDPVITVRSNIATLMEVGPGESVQIRGLRLIGGLSGDPQVVKADGNLIIHDVQIQRNPAATNNNKLVRVNGTLVLRGTNTLEK